MTDPVDPTAPPADRRTSRRRRATLAELVLIVRPPGKPQEIRTFTADERIDAHEYAEQTGAVVEDLL